MTRGFFLFLRYLRTGRDMLVPSTVRKNSKKEKNYEHSQKIGARRPIRAGKVNRPAGRQRRHYQLERRGRNAHGIRHQPRARWWSRGKGCALDAASGEVEQEVIIS
jgi:hypothetical protein